MSKYAKPIQNGRVPDVDPHGKMKVSSRFSKTKQVLRIPKFKCSNSNIKFRNIIYYYRYRTGAGRSEWGEGVDTKVGKKAKKEAAAKQFR